MAPTSPVSGAIGPGTEATTEATVPRSIRAPNRVVSVSQAARRTARSASAATS